MSQLQVMVATSSPIIRSWKCGEGRSDVGAIFCVIPTNYMLSYLTRKRPDVLGHARFWFCPNFILNFTQI